MYLSLFVKSFCLTLIKRVSVAWRAISQKGYHSKDNLGIESLADGSWWVKMIEDYKLLDMLIR